MTEQLYRRRAGKPVKVWHVGDGEPPEWAGNWNRWHEYHDNFVVIRTTAGWKMQDATSFARGYEPLPAPAPDAREALDEATLTVIYEALRFADWAAGEGICPDIEARPEPAEFLSAYIEAKGMTDADYADLPEYVRQALARIGGGA